MKPDLPIDTQILWLAAEIIEKGHCKRSFAHRTARCALGAILDATRQLESAKDGARAVSRLQGHIPGGNIVFWNDAPERTAAEVALALRTA